MNKIPSHCHWKTVWLFKCFLPVKQCAVHWFFMGFIEDTQIDRQGPKLKSQTRGGNLEKKQRRN